MRGTVETPIGPGHGRLRRSLRFGFSITKTPITLQTQRRRPRCALDACRLRPAAADKMRGHFIVAIVTAAYGRAGSGAGLIGRPSGRVLRSDKSDHPGR